MIQCNARLDCIQAKFMRFLRVVFPEMGRYGDCYKKTGPPFLVPPVQIFGPPHNFAEIFEPPGTKTSEIFGAC